MDRAAGFDLRVAGQLGFRPGAALIQWDRVLPRAGLTPLRRLRTWLMQRDRKYKHTISIDASERDLLRRVCLIVAGRK